MQIRPDHNVQYYILVCYNLFEGEIGKDYIFLIPSNILYSLIPKYGGYAHGTIERLGEITKYNLFGNNFEYALRPNPEKQNSTKPKKLWKEFLKYQVQSLEEIKISC